VPRRLRLLEYLELKKMCKILPLLFRGNFLEGVLTYLRGGVYTKLASSRGWYACIQFDGGGLPGACTCCRSGKGYTPAAGALSPPVSQKRYLRDISEQSLLNRFKSTSQGYRQKRITVVQQKSSMPMV